MSRLTSPIVAKQIEKEITSEARKEENAFRHVVKDFERLEKLDAKAHKVKWRHIQEYTHSLIVSV